MSIGFHESWEVGNIECTVCFDIVTNDMPYTEMGVCGSCVKKLANLYWLKHSGAPHQDFACREELDAYKASFPPSTKKHVIKPSLRTAVYERDAYRCVKCNAHKDLSVDHVYPRSKGGTDDFDNLQTLCRTCNSIKRDRVDG